MAPSTSQVVNMPSADDTDIDIPAVFADVLRFILLAYNQIVVAHPYITGFCLIMWSYHPRAPFQAVKYIIHTLPKKILKGVLRQLGFRKDGVQADSYASRYQAAHYQGHIPEDSSFSRYQSYGTLDDIPSDEQGITSEPTPSAWWGILGWGVYFSGFAIMLFHGSLKGT